MGVPSFYRWLVGKYPKIVVNAIEEKGDSIDSSGTNPNGMEFDNLYLDMNGIIHPCFHPEDQLYPPTTYNEVFAAIFVYIDRIFSIVRPRQLLYMAIDGVAPRAKLNQQRSRRFQTAKYCKIAEDEELRLRQEFERAGKKVLPKEEYEVSDSNVITPGTIFMQRLSKALEYYIHLKLNKDPGWKKIKVILSDSNIPGEGEHKIMSFIRLQRTRDGYDPNTRHCLYGLDADLVMLALATHEPHFSILREDVLKQETVFQANLCRKELNMVKSRGWVPRVLKERDGYTKKPYQFLNIWTLREYLALDMKIPDSPFETDSEKIVDDFIFICFFLGNDFLPHMPSLEIHEGAIDLLITVYKKMFKKMGGYLIDASRVREKKFAYVELKRVEQFITEIGSFEDRIFSKRYNLRQKKMKRWLREKLEEEKVEDDCDNTFESLQADFSKQCSTSTNLEVMAFASDEADVTRNTTELKQKLKDCLRDKEDIFKNGVFENDKVKLGIPGWKGRYYKEKFDVESPVQIEDKRKEIVQKYMEGLCWVVQYYFAGVPSWGWFYPFHYGPFASDLKGLSRNVNLNLGLPLKPFDQLMAVLPPRSSNALPKAYRQLMSSDDQEIKKIYPTDFVVDMDGKRFYWQGVVKLPFIKISVLQEMTKKKEKELDIDEVERNCIKNDKILVLHSEIHTMFKSPEQIFGKPQTKYQIDEASCKLNGYLSLCVNHTGKCYFSPIEWMTDITEDHAISAIFENPDYLDHIPKLIENAIEPEKTITEADIVERKLWHEYDSAQPPCHIRQQRYVPREEESEQASPLSTREIHRGAGSGWGSSGRGKELVGSSYTGRGNMNIYGNYRRGSGQGRGYLDTRNFGRPSYCSRGNNVFNGSCGSRGHAYSSNNSYRGTQQPARSVSWQSRSTALYGDSGRGRGNSSFGTGTTSYIWNAEPSRFSQLGRTRSER